MIKYYTRACNFYYGNFAKKLIKNKKALPLCGSINIAFDTIEIFQRKNKKIKSKIVHLKNIKRLNKIEKKIVKKNLAYITAKRKNFLKNVNFSEPSIMGILNLTPDSFSDGGRHNSKKKSLKQISNMINSGAKIIDVGGESTQCHIIKVKLVSVISCQLILLSVRQTIGGTILHAVATEDADSEVD